ncbi:MAG: GTPase domain-containing protein [Kangiellaceae bacterium]|nr:GTPase domain-containing protein [Kangiellaceae bacterium]MCW8999986.1 GTPase domain-containing protein [Kangiellaceae bacterium]
MADWNSERNVLTLKLVYYGPALSGKTTNIISIHDQIQPELKGDMQILETQNDRTLFFDLLPLGIKTQNGTLIKLKLYTVPGQVIHNSTRKAVLSRCDGIIFVADSQSNQSENNAEAFNNLIHNAKIVGIDIEKIPLVVQFNKRDLNKILSETDIKQRWKKSPWPLFLASALQNQGVLETLQELLNLVYDYIDTEHALLANHNLSKEQFVQQIVYGNVEC